MESYDALLAHLLHLLFSLFPLTCLAASIVFDVVNKFVDRTSFISSWLALNRTICELGKMCQRLQQ